MSQQPAPAPITSSDRIWTIPNVISFVRLLGVPLFLYLLLGPEHDVAAVIVLAVGGTTDWVDGYVARRLGQVSRLGELLDPFADRLYILATLVGFTVREIIPWWLTAALLLRELVLGVALLVLRRHGYGPPPVHYLGKTGTFVLLAAFPVLLLAGAVPAWAPVVSPFGWGLAWWALGLYWAAGVLYLAQAAALLRADRAAGPGGTPPPAPGPGGTPPPAPGPGGIPPPAPGLEGTARPPGMSGPDGSRVTPGSDRMAQPPAPGSDQATHGADGATRGTDGATPGPGRATRGRITSGPAAADGTAGGGSAVAG
jgi:cardiolipin synthase